MAVRVIKFVFNEFGVNTYLVAHRDSNNCLVIDPGMNSEKENSYIDSVIEDNGFIVRGILLTHGHFDHIMGVNHIVDKYGCAVYGHKNDEFLLSDVQSYASIYGISTNANVHIDKYLSGTDSLDLSGETIEVLHTPGHSPGHLSYVLPESKLVFTGDALFKGSIGRTDLPGGDLDMLMDSLWRKILVLEPQFRVHPGHGDSTTIGAEKNSNPFLTS